jgi:23S rRNA (guanosine2251-2'-O)-methyltransferase
MFRKDTLQKKDSFVYGIHPVIEALESGKTIDKVWIQEGVLQGQLKDILKLLRDKNIIWKQVPIEKLNSLVRGNHQGIVVALSAIDFAKLEDVIADTYERGEEPFILVLDGITDVRNFGAIARTASCAGIHAIVVPEKGGAAIGPDAIKTSAGALFKIPVCRTNSMYGTVKVLKNSGLQIVGASEKGASNLFESTIEGPVAVIMGSEETGLSVDVWKLCDQLLKIPLMPKGVESLNVSVASGIFVYEVLRQRTKNL